MLPNEDRVFKLLVDGDGRNQSYARADLRNEKLTQACLAGANLSEVDFSGADLREADLSKANLVDANLSGADLSRANLSLANLTKVQAIGADFTNTIMTGACIQDLNVSAATRLEGIVCDYVFYLSNGKGQRHPQEGRNFAPGGLAEILKRFSATKEAAFRSYDLFISHASEDKEFVKQLVEHLITKRGLRVWYDSHVLTAGDPLYQSIGHGLINSRFGVVILSRVFFAKYWTKEELEGLIALEEEGRKVIIPIWHRVTKEDVRAFNPMLANRLAISSDLPIDEVAERILQAVNRP